MCAVEKVVCGMRVCPAKGAERGGVVCLVDPVSGCFGWWVGNGEWGRAGPRGLD